jgi:hypothetical protein
MPSVAPPIMYPPCAFLDEAARKRCDTPWKPLPNSQPSPLLFFPISIPLHFRLLFIHHLSPLISHAPYPIPPYSCRRSYFSIFSSFPNCPCLNSILSLFFLYSNPLLISPTLLSIHISHSYPHITIDHHPLMNNILSQPPIRILHVIFLLFLIYVLNAFFSLTTLVLSLRVILHVSACSPNFLCVGVVPLCPVYDVPTSDDHYSCAL